MKKVVKIMSIFLFILLIFGLSKNVEANSISKISMDIYIEKNGDATITEVWTCNNNQGTEAYHPYYNLGKSQIKNLTVSENGRQYQTLNSWNTSGSLSTKAYKCGINEISNGVEICWGISQYGAHNYTVKYTITNFISELQDSQMLYWTFIPYDFSTSIGSVYIKVHTYFDIPNSTDVWGYGNYGGTAYVYDGYIEMQSDGRLATEEYMTMLVKFPKESFNTSNYINKDFDFYLSMAEEGSTKYDKSNSINEEGYTIGEVFEIIFPIIFGLGFIGVLIIGMASQERIDFGPEGKKIPKDVPYYRDIPCDGEIFKAYYIAYTYGLVKNKTDILGAIILKWIKEGKVFVQKENKKGVFSSKEEVSIVLNKTNVEGIEDQQEKELFEMLYVASEDGILEKKEVEKWSNKNYTKLLNWFDNILKEYKLKLKEEGLIQKQEKGKVIKRKTYIITPQVREMALEIAGLKRYLKEYTLIKEREAIEVALFEDYLIYAQMLGIAKEVAKEFKDLYPDIIEQSNFSDYDNIIFINYYSATIASTARNAQARANSYSSGGGGFSSGGGGGGSFGGRRRRTEVSVKIMLLQLKSIMMILCFRVSIKNIDG